MGPEIGTRAPDLPAGGYVVGHVAEPEPPGFAPAERWLGEPFFDARRSTIGVITW
jgi:hypothetical protein